MTKETVKTYKFFCVICKEHFEFSGKNKKKAEENFEKFGHRYFKVKQLRKGLVGVWPEATKVTSE